MADKKQSKLKMSEEEKRQWDALYMFVKYEILGYDENMDLPRYFVLRLKGMAQGNLIAKAMDEAPQTYGYKVVLKTFEKKQAAIQWAINHSKFNNERHKFNWIMRLIENNINDVYLSMKDEENRLQVESSEDSTKKLQQSVKERKTIYEVPQPTEKLHTPNIVDNFKNATKKVAEKTWSDDDESLW